MKKGIIMEQHRRYTIIMTKEGTFQKAIPIRNAAIGAEVSYKGFKTGAFTGFNSMKKINVPTKLFVMICVLVLFLAPFYLTMGKNETYAYVNVDINPSIELKIDEDLDVYSIRPINNDATKLVNELTGYQDIQLEKVIRMIMAKSEETELINEDKNMLVGISYMAKESDTNSVSDLTDLSTEESDWGIATFHVPKDVRETAKKENKSMNEVMAATMMESEFSVENSSTNSMNDEEKAIIHTFYHTEKENHSEDDNVEEKDVKPQESHENTVEEGTKEKSTFPDQQRISPSEKSN